MSSAGGAADSALAAPNAARVYDFLLNGGRHFAADRAAAAQLLAAMPTAGVDAMANRAFLIRAVRYLMDNGVRQFLDIGCGLPTGGDVHEVAGGAERGTRVVYVDADPIVVESRRRQLTGSAHAAVLLADVRDPGKILDSDEALEILDVTAPIGLVMTSVWHFVPTSDDICALLGEYRDALPCGSGLVLSHLVVDHLRPFQLADAADVFQRTLTPLTPRASDEVRAFFTGFTAVPASEDGRGPAIGPVTSWRPDPTGPLSVPSALNVYGGVGLLGVEPCDRELGQ